MVSEWSPTLSNMRGRGRRNEKRLNREEKWANQRNQCYLFKNRIPPARVNQSSPLCSVSKACAYDFRMVSRHRYNQFHKMPCGFSETYRLYAHAGRRGGGKRENFFFFPLFFSFFFFSVVHSETVAISAALFAHAGHTRAPRGDRWTLSLSRSMAGEVSRSRR